MQMKIGYFAKLINKKHIPCHSNDGGYKERKIIMKTLTHNGIDVIVQQGKNSFIDTLISKGIPFVELPVLIGKQIRVLQYSVNAVTKYAIVELFDGGEGDDWYQIFITSSAPADGWNELYTDCLRQLNGEKPTKIKSRLKMAILAIDRVITEKKNKNIDKENISDEEKFTKLMIGYSFDDYTEKDWKDMALGLWHYGYFKDNIDYFATDIDLDLLNNIKKYL